MTNSEIIEKTRLFLEENYISESSGHDYWHMYRVWQTAKRIASKESSANTFVVELAALLHDVDDWKFAKTDQENKAEAWLKSLEVDENVIKNINQVIENVCFKGGGTSSDARTIEGKIVQDADRLDAIGAIGIARTFTYSGAKGQGIHNPNRESIMYNSFESYKKSASPAITHFHEKLLLLKDRMQTETGKAIAEHRHEFMEKYLKEFYDEWNGKL